MRSTVLTAHGSATESARSALRRATAPYHERVDRLFSRADMTTKTGYSRFLLAQAQAYLPVEAALTRSGAAHVLGDWPARQRHRLLTADLAELGLAASMTDATVVFESDEAVLGGVYVLEGSRLGGALLKRQVSPALPRTFLGASDTRLWRRLLATLEERLMTPEQRDLAIAAAVNTFTVFEAAAAAL